MAAIKKLPGVLNEPFMLWLFSSVVVGFVSWQYAEIQRASLEREADDQVVRRAKIELDLQLRDVQFLTSGKEDMTAAQLSRALMFLQYKRG